MSELSGVQCETCEKRFIIVDRSWRYVNMPDGWVVLFPGNPQHHKGWHFCTTSCLKIWLKDHPKPEEEPE